MTLVTPPVLVGDRARRGAPRSPMFAATGAWSAFAEPLLFFGGWICSGLLIGCWMVRRGHERRTTLAVGASLGPFALMLAGDTARRGAEALEEPLMLRRAMDHGGDIDVIVVLAGEVDGVREVVPNVRAIRPRVRTCTVVKVVDIDATDEELRERHLAELDVARLLLPVSHIGSELHRGGWHPVLASLRGKDRRLVLLAWDPPTGQVGP